MRHNREHIKFTVIIPTRERYNTLLWSLKTCVEQDYDNLEIIVSDNFSEDKTCDVVESYKDKRVRYINTGKRLSMTANFEFAMSHATGDYIGFIGDDDALMPNSISELNELLGTINPEAVNWRKPVYGWNDLSSAARNSLAIPLKKDKLRKIDTNQKLRETLNFGSSSINPDCLPALYHGFIRSDVLFKLRSLTGQFFYSINPDVYAAMAASCVIAYHWQAPMPCSIAGSSSHANSAWVGGETKNLKKYLDENDLSYHPNIKEMGLSWLLIIAESFLQVQDVVPEAKQLKPNVKNLIEKTMEGAVSITPQNYETIMKAVRHIGRVYNIEDIAEKAISNNPNNPLNVNFILTGYNFMDDFLVVKFDEEKVKNIYDASLMCKKILDNKSLEMYAVESTRFLLSALKNYGVQASIKKLVSRAAEVLNFA